MAQLRSRQPAACVHFGQQNVNECIESRPPLPRRASSGAGTAATSACFLSHGHKHSARPQRLCEDDLRSHMTCAEPAGGRDFCIPITAAGALAAFLRHRGPALACSSPARTLAVPRGWWAGQSAAPQVWGTLLHSQTQRGRVSFPVAGMEMEPGHFPIRLLCTV